MLDAFHLQVISSTTWGAQRMVVSNSEMRTVYGWERVECMNLPFSGREDYQLAELLYTRLHTGRALGQAQQSCHCR
jgi:hypothetical protein